MSRIETSNCYILFLSELLISVHTPSIVIDHDNKIGNSPSMDILLDHTFHLQLHSTNI
jgi:hypothetical protein